MASLRERYSVSWDDGEPVEVQTTVKDLITAADSIPPGQSSNVILLETTLIYCALRRQGHQVQTYEEWIVVLDHYKKLPTQVVVEGPTIPAAMPGEQLPLRVSLEPTGDHGYLTKMTTEPSSQLSNS